MSKTEEWIVAAEAAAKAYAEKDGETVTSTLKTGDPTSEGASPNTHWVVRVRLEMEGGKERAFRCVLTEETKVDVQETAPG